MYKRHLMYDRKGVKAKKNENEWQWIGLELYAALNDRGGHHETQYRHAHPDGMGHP